MISKSKTVKNNKVDKALIFGFIPLLAMEYMVMERVDTPEPVVKKLITKSSTDRVKASSSPVITLGIISGSITL